MKSWICRSVLGSYVKEDNPRRLEFVVIIRKTPQNSNFYQLKPLVWNGDLVGSKRKED